MFVGSIGICMRGIWVGAWWEPLVEVGGAEAVAVGQEAGAWAVATL